MAKKLSLLTIQLLLFQQLSAQVFFERVYGGALPEVFRSVVETSDSGLLAGGSTRSFGFGNLTSPDYYLVKTAANGDTLWTRTFGTASVDEGYAVSELPGGYVISGYGVNPATSTYDFYAVKVNLNGDSLWAAFYGGTGSDYGSDMITIPGERLLVCGITSTYTNGGFDYYLLKVSGAGDLLDSANYGGVGNDIANRVKRAGDGGYFIIGYSVSGLPSFDIYLVKVDSLLNFQWSKTYGGPGTDIGYDVWQDSAGNIFILGSWENSPDTSNMVLIRTDSNGLNPVIHYPGTNSGDYGFRLAPVADGYLVAGYTFAGGKGSEMLLIKTDLNGDTLWTSHFGGVKNEVATTVFPFSNGDIVVAGETEGFGIDNVDAYLVRTNTNGEIFCPTQVTFTASDSIICEDQTAAFTNTTVSSHDFTWTQNGNFFSNDINAGFYFNDSGNYEITLASCTAFSSQLISVIQKPATYFTYSISGDTVNFMLNADVSPAAISWNFGDGSPLNTIDLNPIHIYANPGLYWVVLSVTGENGCDSTYVEQISLFTGTEMAATTPFSVSVFPHPLHQNGIIVLNGNFTLPMSASILDLSGKELKQFTVSQQSQNFSAPGLPPGSYVLELKTGGDERFLSLLILQ